MNDRRSQARKCQMLVQQITKGEHEVYEAEACVDDNDDVECMQVCLVLIDATTSHFDQDRARSKRFPRLRPIGHDDTILLRPTLVLVT